MPVHVRALLDTVDALDNFFRASPDIYVGANMLLYYEEGNPARSRRMSS